MAKEQGIPKLWEKANKNESNISNILDRSTNMKIYYGELDSLFGDPKIGIIDVIKSMEYHSVAHIVVQNVNTGVKPESVSVGGTLIITKLNPYRVDIKFIEDVYSTNLRVFEAGYHDVSGFTGWKEVFTDSSCQISKAQTGWCRFANGLIVQWGLNNIPKTQGAHTINLPITFSSVCNGSFTRNYAHGSPSAVMSTGGFYTTHIGIWQECADGVQDGSMYNPYSWIAIGY